MSFFLLSPQRVAGSRPPQWCLESHPFLHNFLLLPHCENKIRVHYLPGWGQSWGRICVTAKQWAV